MSRVEIVGDLFGVNSRTMEWAPKASVVDIMGVTWVGDVDDILFVVMVASEEDMRPDVVGLALATPKPLVALHVLVCWRR